MDRSQVISTIRSFLGETHPAIMEADLSTNLFDSKLLDSAAIVDLVLFLEESFGLRLGDEDLSEDNFASLEALAAFVLGKART